MAYLYEVNDEESEDEWDDEEEWEEDSACSSINFGVCFLKSAGKT